MSGEFPFGLDETGYERYLEARDDPPDKRMKCVRCGAWEDETGRLCRDDHDHSFKPEDHWLHRRGS